jgi:hypothetical protein
MNNWKANVLLKRDEDSVVTAGPSVYMAPGVTAEEARAKIEAHLREIGYPNSKFIGNLEKVHTHASGPRPPKLKKWERDRLARQKND